VPGIQESLEIQVVTELVTQSAQEGSERGDLFAYRRFHPHADKNGVRVIVAKQFDGRSLPHAQGPGGEAPQVTLPDAIEVGRRVEKLSRNSQNFLCLPSVHRRFDGGGDSAQPVILRHSEGIESVAFCEEISILLPGWWVGYHSRFILHEPDDSNKE
jgi:hypothetical protein